MFGNSKNFYLHLMMDDGCWRSWGKYRKFSTQLEVAWMKKISPGFCFHIGDASSETPVDIMISFYWLAFFWGCDWPGLGKLCAMVGRGHKRNISLKFHNGQMWWELWYDDDGGYDRHHRDKCDQSRHPKLWPWSRGRKKYRPWMCLREGNIALNPLSALWGDRFYYREVVDEAMVWVYVDQFAGDRYEVRFRLKKVARYRGYGPSWVRHQTDCGYEVDWYHTPGIPTQNHSWKGDNTLGSGFHVDDIEYWQDFSSHTLAEWVKKERVNRGYRPRTPKESNE